MTMMALILARDYDVEVLDARQTEWFSGYIDIQNYNPERVKLEGFSISDGTYIAELIPF